MKSLLPLALLCHSALQSADAETIRPNIVFIEVDDLSYKYVGCLNSPVARTPNIDALAERGVIFRNAVAPGTMCAPSRNALITALYPHNLGLYQNGDMRQLPQGVWTFPKALQRSGYYTAWVGKCHVRPYAHFKNPNALAEEMGFDLARHTLGRTMIGQGKTKSDDWYVNHLKERGLLEHFNREYSGKTPTTLPEDDYLDGFFTRTAIDFLDGYHEGKPLFLWVNYSLPHDPHDAPQEYQDLFKPADMPGVNKADFVHPPNLIARTKKAGPENKVKNEQAGYCASIAYLDRQVGRVMQALEKKGILDNTVVVFFSDQGLMAGDHGLKDKCTLFQQITNPALIISAPKRFASGRTVQNVVSLNDLVFTTLDLAGANASEKTLPDLYSLMPLLTGEEGYAREAAFAEIEGYVAAVRGNYRYIRGADASLLFDESVDPDDLKNIAAEHPEIVEQMSRDIDNWFKQTGAPLPPKSF
ncbi:MAG: sulfatase-like hydrolase/transferase [Verrucomicrobia bacterium]|nr:sulfatase-like hydrolase/transferase [Verrucomicrobiota bacterium]